MTVKQLKEAIKDLPDDAPVLVPASDHCYNPAYEVITEATMFSQGREREYSEFFGDEHLEENEKKIAACIIT